MGCFTRAVLLFALLCLLALLVLIAFSRMTHSAGSAPAAFSVVVAHPASVSASSDVRGRPSLSPSFINRVLAFYHSPAAGLGQAMYTDSLRYHIDDAFALAFFLHESRFGTTGVARYTHSLGNIICTPGWLRCVGRFRWYSSFAAGCLDWFRLLATEYLPRGLSTLARIVPVYAPSSDGNNVSGYINAVVAAVTMWRAGKLEVTA
jgi:hypothetical protein